MPPTHKVCLEVGAKRTFFSALDWPGWTRGGRNEDEALQALVAYGSRYAAVLRRKVSGFTGPTGVSALNVVERLPGNATTDFGAPAIPSSSDDRPLKKVEAERLESILRACWAALDRAADAARGVTLRTGPRGGGRTLDGIVAHVSEAERAYLGKIGGTHRTSRDPASRQAVASVRQAVLDTMRARVRGEPVPENPRRGAALWPVRYFVRRTAWHALDHTWEIEDRAGR
jgi:hypothetical protein